MQDDSILWEFLTETDGKGNITTYAYDAQNRLTRVTNAKGEVNRLYL